MSTGALIPCRIGSKRVPNKNFSDFCGAPLWTWTSKIALESKIFDKIIISSNGGLAEAIDQRIQIQMEGTKILDNIIFDNARPFELSDDNASLDQVLIYYLNKYPEIDLWCLLQPTSPLRTAEDIKNAYNMMLEKDGKRNDFKYDSLVSVKPNPIFAWIANSVGLPEIDEPQSMALYPVQKRPNRQDRKDWYLENGAIYFSRKYVIEFMKCRLHGSIGLYVMPEERSIDIDSEFDWKIAEFLMRENGLA